MKKVWVFERERTSREDRVANCRLSHQVSIVEAYDEEWMMWEELEKMDPGQRPDMIFYGITPSDENPASMFKSVRLASRWSRIIVISHVQTAEIVEAAIAAGAVGFLDSRDGSSEIPSAIDMVAAGGHPMSPGVGDEVFRILSRRLGLSANPHLSTRENQLLLEIADGLTAKEIALKLGLSVHTVNTHTRHLFRKLKVRTRSAAVSHAMRDGLL